MHLRHSRNNDANNSFVIFNFTKIIFIMFVFLLCLPLTRQGMFVDGVWYAAIAKNMAAGLGNIWDPALSKTLFLHFREHPPLSIAMQSVFFHVLGVAFWVERLYCFCLALLQITLTYKLCQQSFKTKTSSQNKRANSLLLLFLWLIIPVNIGMYKDNLLEGGLTLFTTLACMSLIRNFKSHKSFILHAFFASMCIVAGFMCNGPTALFPLIVPFLYGWFINPTILKQSVFQTISLCIITAFSFIVFFSLVPDALQNIKGFFKIQLVAAITGQRDLSFTGWKHFYIIYIYLKDYIWLGLIAITLVAVNAKINKSSFIVQFKQHTKNPWFRFYFTLSLCASLPVGISHRQMFHYISASSPIILLAVMHLTAGTFKHLLTHMEINIPKVIHKNISHALTVICLVSIATVSYKAGGFNKNKDLIKDVNKIASIMPSTTQLEGSQQIMGYFDVPATFARYSFISFIDPYAKNNHSQSQYYVYYPFETIPNNYQAIDIELSYFKLAKIKHVNH